MPTAKCPARDDSVPIIYPDTDDCTIYYHCSNGVPVRGECPNGQLYNIYSRSCDDPKIAVCYMDRENKDDEGVDF